MYHGRNYLCASLQDEKPVFVSLLDGLQDQRYSALASHTQGPSLPQVSPFQGPHRLLLFAHPVRMDLLDQCLPLKWNKSKIICSLKIHMVKYPHC